VADDFNLENLQNLSAEKLRPIMRPSCFVRVDRIPRNQSGKILRNRLSKEFAGLLST
jgi:acyl-coenzyme A synthetase/AMP-(fatty) acid ligase